MRKIVVLGSTGMAGHMISCYMEEHGFQVYRVSRSEKNSDRSKRIDVSNAEQLVQYIDELEADVVINCVGLLQKSCESRPDLAVLINSYMPHCLEHHYRETKVKLVHLSTDCVFSGDKGRYGITDLPDGRSFYDRSKALGEIDNEKDITFRMSIIGPDITTDGTGLFNWFMKQVGTVRGFSNVIWNGITTLELSKAIVAALHENLTGIYQLVPDECISKYHLLLLFQNIFNKKDVEIVSDENFTINKTLVNERTDFSYVINAYPDQLKEMKEWVDNHRELYPEYYYNG